MKMYVNFKKNQIQVAGKSPLLKKLMDIKAVHS